MIQKRFCVVPMPLDSDGHGPADRKDAVRWEFEVWDEATNLSVASFNTRGEANAFATTADGIAHVTNYLRSIGE